MQRDGAILLPGSLEDRRLASIGECCSDASHEVVLRVVPNLDLSQLDHLLFEHLLHFGLSGPLEVDLAVFVHTRQYWQLAQLWAGNCQGVVEENFLKLLCLRLQEHVNLVFKAVLVLHSTLRNCLPVHEVFMKK